MATTRTRPLGALYPTQLLHFRRCPLSWRLRYVDRQPIVEQPSPALALGNAVHEILAALLRQPSTVWSEIDLLTVQRLVKDHLQVKGVHSGDALEVAAVDGCYAVRFCLDRLDRDVEVLGVERTVRYQSRALDRYGATLAARIDLLVRHPDGEIETYDWKTGRDDNEEDTFQAALCRMVVSSVYPEASRDGASVRTTTRYTRTGSDVSLILSREQVTDAWREMLGLVEQMAAVADQACPGRHCQWCPFRGNGCTIPIPSPVGRSVVSCPSKLDPVPSC